MEQKYKDNIMNEAIKFGLYLSKIFMKKDGKIGNRR